MTGPTGGIRWHTTVVAGVTVTWRSAYDGHAGVHAVVDPQSTTPARRILRDGTVEALDDGTYGLTVYGRWAGDRPKLNEVRALTPEYGHVVDALEAGEGITLDPNQDDPLDLAGVADHLGITYGTARRYHSTRRLGEPDVWVGRSPRWWPSTVDAARETWPGQGARTDLTE